jgi:NAD(P)-dependent dehydrogenase (short-subunit alcohol dehydrogenase family)
LAAGSNHQFRGYAANVTDRATIEALSAQILSGVGEVDGVINNAGVIQPFLRLNDLDYATRGRCEDRTGTLKAREHQDHAGRVHAGSELA